MDHMFDWYREDCMDTDSFLRKFCHMLQNKATA